MEVFQLGLKYYIAVMWNVIRYTNVFLLKWEFLLDKTDWIDLIGLTYLRVFGPWLYAKLPKEKDMLCGGQSCYSYNHSGEEKLKKKL